MDVTTCHVFVRPSLAFESLDIVGAKMADESNPRSESLVAECIGEC